MILFIYCKYKMEQVKQNDEEQIIQIDEEHNIPLSIHGINKKKSQNTSPTNESNKSFGFGGSTNTFGQQLSAAFSGAFGVPTSESSKTFSFGASSQKPSGAFSVPTQVNSASSSVPPNSSKVFGFQMCGHEPKVERHPETGQPIKNTPFQFGISTDRKQHLETLYYELNNMRNKIENCNKTLDTLYYSNGVMTNQIHTEYNNLREYYNNITKSIDKFYETLRFIN